MRALLPPCKSIHGLFLLILLAACNDDADPGAPDAGDDTVDAAPVPDGVPGVDAADWGIDPDRMYALVEELASDPYEGRSPGTAGGDLALELVEGIFGDIGLTPAGDAGFRQGFPLEYWEQLEPAALTVDSTTVAEGDEGFRLLGHSGSGTASGPVVFVGYGLTVPPFDPVAHPGCPLDPAGYDDYAGVDVSGKVVVVLRNGPDADYDIHDRCPASEASLGGDALFLIGYKAANARLHGAAGMLLVQHYATEPYVPQVDVTEAYYDASFPAAGLHRDLAEAALPDLPAWAASIDGSLAPSSHETAIIATLTAVTEAHSITSANLLGVIPGADPTIGHEVVLVGAHIDHVGIDRATGDIFHGADDNASGTAVMTELARVMVESGITPARTIVFAAWNGEELGLVGSCHYAYTDPAYPLEDTVAMLSVDMVGAGDGSGLFLYGGLETANAAFLDLMVDAAAADGLPYQVQGLEALDASDHACFASAGVPAMLALTMGPHAYYHTPADTIDTIVRDDLEAAARIVWASLRVLALGQEAGFAKPAAALPRPALPRTPPSLARELRDL